MSHLSESVGTVVGLFSSEITGKWDPDSNLCSGQQEDNCALETNTRAQSDGDSALLYFTCGIIDRYLRFIPRFPNKEPKFLANLGRNSEQLLR